MEEWMPIQGALGYEISNKGEVKGRRGKLLKQYTKIIYSVNNIRYHKTYVRIQKRVMFIRELIDANKPSSILTGVIWI
jgi:hypothetical protein